MHTYTNSSDIIKGTTFAGGRCAAQGTAGSGGYVGACGWVAPTNVECENAQWEGDQHGNITSGLTPEACWYGRG